MESKCGKDVFFLVFCQMVQLTQLKTFEFSSLNMSVFTGLNHIHSLSHTHTPAKTPTHTSTVSNIDLCPLILAHLNWNFGLTLSLVRTHTLIYYTHTFE